MKTIFSILALISCLASLHATTDFSTAPLGNDGPDQELRKIRVLLDGGDLGNDGSPTSLRKIRYLISTAGGPPPEQSLLFYGSNGAKFYGNSTAVANWLGTTTDGALNAFALNPASNGNFAAAVWQAKVASGPIFYCETEDEQGIRDAVAKAQAAGGGTVMLPNREITLTSPLPVQSGLGYMGVKPKLAFGAIPDLYNQRPLGGVGNGTVLRGDGTFNIFEANTSNRTTALYSTQIAFSNAGISSFRLENVGIIRGKSGIRIGGSGTPGLFYSILRGVSVWDCEEWGVWMENYQHCIVSDLNVFDNKIGQIAFVMSSGPVLSPGNSHFDSIYAAARGSGTAKELRKSRGIVMWTKNGGIFGSQNFSYIQSTRFGTNPLGGGSKPFGTGIAGNTTNTSANITVADGTEFAVDMPVSMNETTAGFIKNKVYFVTSISGNLIQLSPEVGGIPQAATATGNITIGGSGFAPLELVGYKARETVAAQTPSGNAVTGSAGTQADFLTGMPVIVTTTGTTPGITPGATYFVVRSGTSYSFATSFDNAMAGAVASLSSAWTGTATITATGAVGGFSFDGVDLETGGTAGVVLQNTVGSINLDACSAGNTGGADAVFVQTIVGRNAKGAIYSAAPTTWDTDTSMSLSGYLLPRNSVGNMPVGVVSDTTTLFGFNLDPQNFAGETAISSLTFRTLFNGAEGRIIRPAVQVAQVVYLNTSINFNVGSYNADFIYSIAGSATATLPTIFNVVDDDGNPANGNNLGRSWTIYNATTGVITVNTSSSQTFNNIAGATSVTLGAHQGATFTAVQASGGGALNWAITNRTPNGSQPQVSYAPTVTPDPNRSESILYGPVSADMTIANPTASLARVFPQFLVVEIILDSFPSGTRNITWGNAYKFPTAAFTQPTAVTHANARTVVCFVGFGSGWMALGANNWY